MHVRNADAWACSADRPERGGMIAPALRSLPARVHDPGQREDARGVPSHPIVPTPGRSLVSRRALIEIVRTATVGSYGVTGLAGRGWPERLAALAGMPPRGIRIGLGDELTVDLDLIVAHGLPIAEVARQVDSAVRYSVRNAVGRDVGRLTIRINGLRTGPLEALPGGPLDGSSQRRPSTSVAPDDL